jgi:hypothetical protein
MESKSAELEFCANEPLLSKAIAKQIKNRFFMIKERPPVGGLLCILTFIDDSQTVGYT